MVYTKNDKDFDKWNIEKKKTNSINKPIYFKEGDIWWAKIGVNIGFEQDGKGKSFSRPILIIKKFNEHIFWGISLSTKRKNNKYYFNFDSSDGQSRTAILSQLKLVSSKRITDKIGFVENNLLERIKKAIKDLL